MRRDGSLTVGAVAQRVVETDVRLLRAGANPAPPTNFMEVDFCHKPDFSGPLLGGFSVEYYDYDCGQACTPNGCCGHTTDIPTAFTVGGITFHVDGAESGDFPDEAVNVNRVCAVVKALESAIVAYESRQPIPQA